MFIKLQPVDCGQLWPHLVVNLLHVVMVRSADPLFGGTPTCWMRLTDGDEAAPLRVVGSLDLFCTILEKARLITEFGYPAMPKEKDLQEKPA